MTPQEIVDLLKRQFPAAEIALQGAETLHPSVGVSAAALPAVARFVRDDPRLGMNMLRCITGMDLHPEPWLEVVYDLVALRPGGARGFWEHGGTLALRVRVSRDGGSVPTVSDVWPAADWHERETFDLFGVRFDAHPDLRRILCPDDWVGWPLRKDYEFPKEYQGIPSAAAGFE